MEETDDRPWERPGAVRRDCELHRGPLLNLLGILSLASGMMSVMGVYGLAGAPRTVFIFLPPVTPLSLGLTTWVLARRDLARMQAGLMDPAGRPQTVRGGDNAFVALVLGLVALLGGVLIFLFLLALSF